jgi:hypothetical protein
VAGMQLLPLLLLVPGCNTLVTSCWSAWTVCEAHHCWK